VKRALFFNIFKILMDSMEAPCAAAVRQRAARFFTIPMRRTFALHKTLSCIDFSEKAR
jgi:hypothetical protein